MREAKFEPWLGHCHFARDLGNDHETDVGFMAETATVRETLSGVVAVWAEDREAYETVLRAYVSETNAGDAERPLRLLWAEDVMPATEWMVRHAREKQALHLARQVHDLHRVELGSLVSAASTEPEPQNWLEIEEITGIAPLDAQFGVHPRKTVPDALFEPLFGDITPNDVEIAFYGNAENVPPLKTYAVMDAAKLTGGFSEIENCDMPWRCMFKGKAAIELADVAPLSDRACPRYRLYPDPVYPRSRCP
ncbi:hypothetical protein TH25_05360 [Thalassospira profundimaris]|uniref:Uncharacterized protein n=1 Tax=Thalassospira profundimaris TaxID=502049 RepID=A0A367XFM0_9PROT|nr:hypothetical protein [Thalassospira profundimaris]RCK52474.1 hypothetical protein TH25_05360 [Thalassospira profundimaris]